MSNTQGPGRETRRKQVGGPAGGAGLSRRERQIMDALYRIGPAAVTDVRAALPDPPSYSAVRTLLNILETKQHLVHHEKAGRYIYSPRKSRTDAARLALRRLLGTFFEGSAARAFAALLEDRDTVLSDQDLDRLSQTIEAARGKGKKP